jgi:transposase
MIEAILERLKEKLTLYLDELVLFVYDEFGKHVTIQSLSRALASVGWLNKAARQIAKEQNADLQDYYLHRISCYSLYQLVYVDESGCDKRAGFQRTGWSPLGVTPVQISKFHRDQRYQILPAYTQEGVLLSQVFQGLIDAEMFEDFIEQLLHHCTRRTVIVMDNASFHRTKRIHEMCLDAGVELEFLPPYSPDLNPIKEFFSELKRFIKRRWNEYEENPGQGFKAFLERYVGVVGSRVESAKGHFRHAGIEIEYK